MIPESRSVGDLFIGAFNNPLNGFFGLNPFI
jgi:hypothetical protein